MNKHRVAVVLLMEVESESEWERDGQFLGEQITRAALTGEALGLSGPLGQISLTADGRTSKHLPDGTFTATVYQVMEAGMAMGNGYLWAAPTSKGFPRKDDDD